MKKANNGPQQFKDIFNKKKPAKLPPAYKWQDLALRVIEELGIPGDKRSAVFKACKDNPKHIIEKALNDTKELVKKGEPWRYFFKLIAKKNN